MQPQIFRPDENTPKVVQSHALEDYTHIHDADVEAVIFNRTIPSTVSSFLEDVMFNPENGERFFAPLDGVCELVANTLSDLGGPNGLQKTWLIQDIKKLATQMGEILSSPNIQLRIGVVNNDACKRFHRDNVKARLICTYRGPGTVYGAANPGDEPSLINQVRTGDPILLKGKLWSESTDRTLLHKSPRIEGAGVSRLVVVMDEVLSTYEAPN